MVEPWLRGTLTDIAPTQRAVIHALELAGEDMERWVLRLPAALLVLEPHGLPSVAFQTRHIARSLDRLLTYTEGNALTNVQLAALADERRGTVQPLQLQAELRDSLSGAVARVRAFTVEQLAEPRTVGRDRLPTTVAGLLIHVAEHTQRHVGQAITTSKVLHALANGEAH